MNRRAFIGVLGGAVAWPAVARGQQTGMPVIGFISPADSVGEAHIVAAFRRGLNQTGYVEGTNVIIEIHWLEGKFDRVPAIVADLVSRQVTAIVSTTPGARAAMAATSTIPIVFATGGDPVKQGLVSSLNRPDRNLTGVSFLAPLMETKRLGLIHEMAPQAGVIAVLLNPTGPLSGMQLKEIPGAARAFGLQVQVQHASDERDLDGAFAAFAQARAGALLVVSDPFFNAKREKIIGLAARQMLPAIYEWREFAEAGGLMSYGTSITDTFRQVGVYTGKF
jgi:putative tryptophan/tyrosine transport system substrate-binding protein